MTPKRSRSEAPTGNAIGSVLYEVHKKLMSRVRKPLSPAKLQAKQQERQQRAEHLRAKIDSSRLEWSRKVHQRQELARARFQETVERKRLNLNDRLEQAARNKEDALQNVVEKAKAENLKAEETNYIIKLTQQNNKLDLSNKLTHHDQRRKLQLERDMERIKGQELKREAAGKRREEQSDKIRHKILSKEQKREQAEQRRKEQQIADKNKAIAGKIKRDLVRARNANVKKHKISDIINFVSNRDSLWEFIGMEKDLASMGLQFNLEDIENALDDSGDGLNNMSEQELLSTIQQDQFELEKLMLKRDHDLLSACISEEPDGSIKIMKSPITLLQHRGRRGAPKSSSSLSSDESIEDVKERAAWLQQHRKKQLSIQSGKVQTSGGVDRIQTATSLEENKEQQSPKKQPSWSKLTPRGTASTKADLARLRFSEKQHSASFKSNSNMSSSVRSKDDLTGTEGDLEERKEASDSHGIVSQFQRQNRSIEQQFEQKMQQQRLRVAVRRNILKRNLSEDQVYATELQTNPNFDFLRYISQDVNHFHSSGAHRYAGHQLKLETWSQTSSLERNSFDGLEDDTIGQSIQRESVSHEMTPPKGIKIVKTSTAALAKRNKNKGKNQHKRQSSRSSLHSSGNVAGLSGGSKDLKDMLRRNSYVEGQQTVGGIISKQKRTLSNQGSCSSLSSLIKSKIKQNDQEDFTDLKGVPTPSTLNQAHLEQLGPVVKMTINGFSFAQGVYGPTSSSANTPSQLASIYSNTLAGGAGAGTMTLPANEPEVDPSCSIFSASTSTSHSFQLNSLIMSERASLSKTNLSSVNLMSSNYSKSANLYLFPIREQKIILMYKGEKESDCHFAQAKISVKLEEVKLGEAVQSTSVSQSAGVVAQQATLAQPATTLSTTSVQVQSPQQHQLSTPKNSSSQRKKAQLVDGEQQQASPVTPKKGQQSSTGKHSHGNNGSASRIEETKQTPNKRMSQVHHSNSSSKKETEEQSATPLSSSDHMVNLIVKKLLIDHMHNMRRNDSQNIILSDNDQDSQAVLKYLEVSELRFKYCRLCEVAIYSEYSATSDTSATASNAIVEHFQSKAHVRKRESYSIKESEDTTLSLLVFSSQPGEIEVELRIENEKALKRKTRKLRAAMQQLAVSHENASTYPGKELKSDNKNRLQIRCIELQKSVFPEIRFDTVEAILNDVLKVLEKRGTGDLHLMRKLKFVPIMVDSVCKRITTCPRGKLSNLAKVINLCIEILQKFCRLRENRNYMIQTNRLVPLIDLLSWCLNRQTELFFGIEFMPGLFQTITSHLKHRVPYECQLLKEHMVDLLISSQIPAKLKNKLAIVQSLKSNENEQSLGQLPFFLLKSIAFIEALTAMISIDARTRPVYEKSTKIGEHVFYVIQSTELFGITQMITTLLLTCNETFKASAPLAYGNLDVLPQTILSLTIFSIKVLNNVMRCDVGIAQQLMLELNEQLYHLLSYILQYTEQHIDQNDDVKELLHETLIFIGYFCLLNEGNQKTLHRGENSILQKLCNLPFTYFMDKKLKEILFPTLVTVGYLNERSVAIMDQEMNMSEFLVKYIEINIKEELPRIMEQEQEYFSDHTKSMSSFGRARSPSQLSTGSNSNCSVQMDFLSGNNPYLPLVMRFPKNLWKNAAQYFKSKAD